jgi:hypothetical protein
MQSWVIKSMHWKTRASVDGFNMAFAIDVRSLGTSRLAEEVVASSFLVGR